MEDPERGSRESKWEREPLHYVGTISLENSGGAGRRSPLPEAPRRAGLVMAFLLSLAAMMGTIMAVILAGAPELLIPSGAVPLEGAAPMTVLRVQSLLVGVSSSAFDAGVLEDYCAAIERVGNLSREACRSPAASDLEAGFFPANASAVSVLDAELFLPSRFGGAADEDALRELVESLLASDDFPAELNRADIAVDSVRAAFVVAEPPQVLAPGLRALVRGGVGRVHTLGRVVGNGVDTEPAARSYGGNPWEAVFPLLHTSEYYTSSTGIFSIPDDGRTYVLRGYSAPLPSEAAMAARLMMKATFGPTLEDINRFGLEEGDFVARAEEWMKQQMGREPTLHRAYYRRRANVRLQTPVATGRPRGACEALSRWRRYALSQADRGRFLRVEPSANSTADFYNIVVDDVLLTQVDQYPLSVSANALTFGSVCGVEEKVGGVVSYGDCATDNVFEFANPIVHFLDTRPPDHLVVHRQVALRDLGPQVPDVALLVNASGVDCASRRHPPKFAESDGGEWYVFDPRLRLLANTLKEPASSPVPSGMCPAVKKTFVNAESCVPGLAACAPTKVASREFRLGEDVLRQYYELDGVYAYYVTGLDIHDDLRVKAPCESGTSRWLRHNSTCSDAATRGSLELDNATFDLLAAVISAADDGARVVDVESGRRCSAEKGVKINVNSTCWEHVHPDLYSVYSFNFWTEGHPGNRDALENGRHNPIAAIAERGSTHIAFPAWHDVSWWLQNVNVQTYMGRLGQLADFADLPTCFLTAGIMELFGVVAEVDETANVFEACGSPGEVENDPKLGSRFAIGFAHNILTRQQVMDQPVFASVTRFSKLTVWYNVALVAPDQLRQRVAWALSQILVLNAADAGLQDETESVVAFYDIFVRQAFGNYGDVLKEVAYSVPMAKMLTYLKARSVSVSLDQDGKLVYPDENFAREIMQVFTIGLWKLHANGTKLLENGAPIPTYDNDDVLDFARAWTGFNRQLERGNLENRLGDGSANDVDPLDIRAEWRDRFPKRGLDKKYIGDHYPLCWDLPEKAFLRRGATFRYLGTTLTPDLQSDYVNRKAKLKPLVLARSSELFEVLCNAQGTSRCNFRSEVTLNRTLACFGDECLVDTLHVITVNATLEVFYEYVRIPCVELAVHNAGRAVEDTKIGKAVCVDARLPLATAACCSAPTDFESCAFYSAERMSHSTATDRCRAANASLCVVGAVSAASCYDGFTPYWSDAPCEVQVQVHPDGKVNLVHNMTGAAVDRLWQQVAVDSVNLLRVNWGARGYPTAADACNDVCRVEDDTCVCSTRVVEEQVFAEVPEGVGPESIMARLSIGAVDVSVFDENKYQECSSLACGESAAAGVRIFLDRESGALDARSVFRVSMRAGEDAFLLNAASNVFVGSADDFYFRNPPSFNSHVDATTRDAIYETDDVLAQLLNHQNTAPFIADFLIKRLVTSNPSPRYIEAVATAFRSGKHEDFGAGKVGDLSATVAAVLLDREAMSAEVEADPAFGKLREPLLKVLHFLRSLEFRRRDGMEPMFGYDFINELGMQPYWSPTVFNFYTSEFSPAGPVEDSGLVAPEAEIINTPFVIAYLNGMVSLVEFGLGSCAFGFATKLAENRSCGVILEGLADRDDHNWGSLNFSPPPDASAKMVVSQLDVLLTGGRLHADSRQVILERYIDLQGDREKALRAAMHLLMATPEFQITGLHTPASRSGGSRRMSADVNVARTTAPQYRAVVYLYFRGGMDSYNLVVPHEECYLYDQYAEARNDVAISAADLLEIAVGNGTQPCSKFGLNPNLPFLRQLYQAGEAALVANIGPLVEPISKGELLRGEKRFPRGLFAHNLQRDEVQIVEALSTKAKGVLGRAADALTAQGLRTASFSVAGNTKVLDAEAGESPEVDVVSSNVGSTTFDPAYLVRHLHRAFSELVESGSHSANAETWSRRMINAVARAETLSEALAQQHHIERFEATDASGTGLGLQLEMIARLISARDFLGDERTFFFAEMGGFDAHLDISRQLDVRLRDLDEALDLFRRELQRQGVWDDVVIVATSEFGRTLSSNGFGTDHGWGGHTWVAGGSVRGAQMLGTYPEDLRAGAPLDLGRGRMLPTTSWEAVWNAVACWLGVGNDTLDSVLPNRRNFPSEAIFEEEDLFVKR